MGFTPPPAISSFTIEFSNKIKTHHTRPLAECPLLIILTKYFAIFSLFRDVHCPLLAIYSIWKHRTTSHVQRVPYPIRRTPRLVLHNLTHLHRFPRCLLFLLSLRGNAPRALPISSPTMNSFANPNYPHPTQCTKRLP